MKHPFMLRSTHDRLMAEQVIADADMIAELHVHQATEMAAFKARIVEQAALENKNLQLKVVELESQIAALNGKLVHVLDNPEDYVQADGLGR